MKFWFGQRGWGWRLWGVSYGDKWFIGLSIKQQGGRADTLNSPHPGCVSSLAYMSQLDKDRGREYVPLYAAPVATQNPEDARDAERYRKLRAMATQQADYLGPIFRIDVRRSAPYLFNFDAAVDAAPKGEQ